MPGYHIVVVQARQLMRFVEDGWPRSRRRSHRMTRSVGCITGPSRTADVERTLQLGAHGPRSVHIIYVDG